MSGQRAFGKGPIGGSGSSESHLTPLGVVVEVVKTVGKLIKISPYLGGAALVGYVALEVAGHEDRNAHTSPRPSSNPPAATASHKPTATYTPRPGKDTAPAHNTSPKPKPIATTIGPVAAKGLFGSVLTSVNSGTLIDLTGYKTIKQSGADAVKQETQNAQTAELHGTLADVAITCSPLVATPGMMESDPAGTAAVRQALNLAAPGKAIHRNGGTIYPEGLNAGAIEACVTEAENYAHPDSKTSRSVTFLSK